MADYALSILFTCLLSGTYKSGAWVNYNIFDYINNFFYFLKNLIALPLNFARTKDTDGEEINSRGNLAWQIGRGLLLAIPILIVFILLLSSADLIFAQWVEDSLQFFNIEDLINYFLQGILILTIAFIFTGLIRYAEIHSHHDDLKSAKKPFIEPFLGFTEGTTVLVSVVILLSIFVIIQFRYFFWGEMNITETGFTYAEYARRGFGELIMVAILSLLIIQSIRIILKFKNSTQRKIFISLVIGLVLLVLVILTSSFQRLLLYESAYGFSSLRIYSHIFIIWLGLLLISVIILELIDKPRFFANAVLFAMVGFVISLNLLNTDSLIVHQNIKRAETGMELDGAYLAGLSSDAVPQLVKEYKSIEHTTAIQDEIGAILACQKLSIEVDNRDSMNKNWQSSHYSDWKAERILKSIKKDFDRYQIQDDDSIKKVISPNGVELECLPLRILD